jgi:menaquinone-specific isochorismate synthase
MGDMRESGFAMVARTDGSVVIGRGPFVSRANPPVSGVAFYRNDFGLGDAEPWKIPASWQVVDRAGALAALGGRREISCAWEELNAGPFTSVFLEVSEAIRHGVFEKTVPVVTERGRLCGGNGQDLAAVMAGLDEPLLPYAWIEGEQGFAGATPEVLFALDGRKLSTMALAGTARAVERAVFAVDEKEIREHEIVALSLVSKLGDIGVVRKEDRSILDLGGLVHFHTAIRVELNQSCDVCDPGMLVRRLHPTPALGPLPRVEETMRLLLQWRERLGCPEGFGAPFGVIEDGRFLALVSIRGIWWDGPDLLLPAGCGVIEASRLVNEWRELRLKREAVKSGIAGRS